MIDLRPDHLDTVQRILAEHVPECEVRAFGSRAAWTAKDYSDLDLAVVGAGPLDWRNLGRLREAFEESSLPMRVDVLDWHAISESFRRVIKQGYVVVQERAKHTTADEWREVALGDLINIGHGFAFKGASIHDEPRGDVLLTPGNFAVGGGFKRGRFKYYDGPVSEEFVLNEGDLLVTMTDLSKQSDTLGYPAAVPPRTEGHRYLHNQRLGKISPKAPEEVCMRYIYHVMCTEEYRHEVLAGATGTTVKHTSPDRIKRFRFALPPLPEQRAIAHVLGTLDEKIELNRRMNETLESMARALFKDWFVDFGPARAKMAGREPYLPPDVWSLFPDRLAPSELGDIPAGWEVKALDDIATFLNGLALQKYPVTGDSALPVIKIAQLRAGHTVGADLASSDLPPQYIVRDGDVLFSWSGSLEVDTWTGGDGALNQHLFKVTSTEYPQWLYYLCIREHLQAFREIAADKATTMGHIKRHHLSEAATVMPPVAMLRAMNRYMQPLLERSLSLRIESRALATLRDALLPSLVSGSLRVTNGSDEGGFQNG